MKNIGDFAEVTTRPRVLFLRSHSKICALSFIANGLKNSQQLEFAQYPTFPSNKRAKLQKLPQSEDAWQDLNTNLIRNYQELSEKLSQGYFDCVLFADYDAYLNHYQHLTWAQKLRAWARLFRNHRGDVRTQYQYISAFPLSIAELCRIVPVAVVDLIDHPYLLRPMDVDLLKSCACYFKREIPYDRFVLFHAFFQFQYLSQSGKDEKLISLLDRVHGIPLGIPDEKFLELVKLRVDNQDIDIFWAGRISNSMRSRAVTLLNDFAAKTSWKIVVPTNRLSFQEFCHTVARSKVTISISGGGWDCDRHYEAIALGSVPLINRPTTDAVWWHEMPEQIFFENNFSNFALRLEELLTRESLRQQCFHHVEQQIRDHMLWSKIVEYMVTTTMNRSEEEKYEG